MIKKIINKVENYYTEKILQYGPTPKGVDWKDEKSQIIRFKQLIKLLSQNSNFSIGDVGCGYGKFYQYLKENGFNDFKYMGYEISIEMIKSAQKLFKKEKNASFKFIKQIDEIEHHDFIISSGIFNVKFDFYEAEWLSYILNIIFEFNKKTRKGFAFNMLTKYSDKECMKNYLYYADPLFWFDFCKRNFSKNVSLLHDYELYEFSIIVRK